MTPDDRLAQAAQHVSALEIGPEDKLLLALFPQEPGAGGCIYIEVSPGSNWKPENVERELKILARVCPRSNLQPRRQKEFRDQVLPIPRL